MTSPPDRVEVTCPECEAVFEDWLRSSINLSIEPDWTEEEILEATTVRCPSCGWRGGPGTFLFELV